MFSGLNGLFAGVPADAYTRAADIGVSPASLGTGYVVFFLYSAVIGIAGVVLAIMVAARRSEPAGASSQAPA